LLQRVSRAEVRVAGEVVGRIGPGLLVLLGIEQGDDDAALGWYAGKVAELRIFADEQGKMNRSVEEISGALLVVSQFTLAARTRKGRRPSYTDAAEPSVAEPMCERFVELLRARGLPVETGRFGAMMDVELINDGPVTILLEPPS
jgi:D-tyrosyl-tRNA(Tyr) deacylase